MATLVLESLCLGNEDWMLSPRDVGETPTRLALPLQVKSLMKQLLSAVDHCHQRWVMHRDIKMSNLVG